MVNDTPEIKLGHGALRERKPIFRKTLKSHLKRFGAPMLPATYDLTSLYDQFPVEDQGGCDGCSGFAGAQYAQIQTYKRDGKIVSLSKKDIYQNIRQPQGGAYGKDLINYLENYGVCLDDFIPSYMPPDNFPPTEQWMEQKVARTPAAQTDGLSRVFQNAVTFNGKDINEVKQAIYNGQNGALCALWGDNGSWLSNPAGIVKVPSVPATDPSLWGHFLLLIGWNDQTQQIKCKSSWGTGVGAGGYFFIPYAYFTQGYSMSEYTLVEMPSNFVPNLMDKITALASQIISLLEQKIQSLQTSVIQ